MTMTVEPMKKGFPERDNNISIQFNSISDLVHGSHYEAGNEELVKITDKPLRKGEVDCSRRKR